MPLTWRSTTGALAHVSPFIIVGRAQGQVTAATGACGIIKKMMHSSRHVPVPGKDKCLTLM